MNIKQEQEIITAIQHLQVLIDKSVIKSWDKENIRDSLADIQRIYVAKIGYDYMRLIERGEGGE